MTTERDMAIAEAVREAVINAWRKVPYSADETEDESDERVRSEHLAMLNIDITAIVAAIADVSAELSGIPPELVSDPLHDDAAAFRLAVKLGLCLDLYRDPGRNEISVSFDDGSYSLYVNEPQLTDDDPCAAARRAIVRVADGLSKAKEN